MSDVVFVTGATGFIGAHVVRELLESGYRVRALAHHSLGGTAMPGARTNDLGDRAGGSDIEWVAGDVRRAREFANRLSGCRFLVHCAALYSFAPKDRASIPSVNVGGTVEIVEAARNAGVERAVVTSSAATVGPARRERPATEADTMRLDGASTYHRSKCDQERAALAAAVPVTLVLPTVPVGPGDHKPTPTGRLIVDFARGKIKARPSTGGLNIVAVEDVARAHVAALQRGKPGERYLIGGENLTFDAVWDLLAQVTGKSAPTWRAPYGLTVAAAYVDELRCRLFGATPFVPLEGVRISREFHFVDTVKAQRELGFRATPVREALVRAVNWYREHGYLR